MHRENWPYIYIILYIPLATEYSIILKVKMLFLYTFQHHNTATTVTDHYTDTGNQLVRIVMGIMLVSKV